ncbi:MAG: hypothetical protein ACD_39C00269G0001 [uncultured bacterium]|nr:MAG: hypothetical protein ACD_39C00269G0001 [uncultured bacterium]
MGTDKTTGCRTKTTDDLQQFIVTVKNQNLMIAGISDCHTAIERNIDAVRVVHAVFFPFEYLSLLFQLAVKDHDTVVAVVGQINIAVSAGPDTGQVFKLPVITARHVVHVPQAL